jgi:hypothetical protein
MGMSFGESYREKDVKTFPMKGRCASVTSGIIGTNGSEEVGMCLNEGQ